MLINNHAKLNQDNTKQNQGTTLLNIGVNYSFTTFQHHIYTYTAHTHNLQNYSVHYDQQRHR